MNQLISALILFLASGAVGSDFSDTSLDRILKEATASPAWHATGTTSEKLHLIREVALGKDVVSDPVSDRYLITSLAGPIDIVHFLGLAIPICTGEKERGRLLFGHWRSEGGLDHEAGRSNRFPTEAHPDDLPSNALGALFGEEIRDRNRDEAFDVVTAMREFLAPLEPLPDDIAKRFSHRRVVMGLAKDAPWETVRAQSKWFTAQPLFILPWIDPARAKSIGSSENALRAAGFEVTEIDGRPLSIERIR